ncbi:energy transducer TonB [bacterium]|nr:energy transducer TonB [bacterium]
MKNTDSIFAFAVIFSIFAHGLFFLSRTDIFKENQVVMTTKMLLKMETPKPPVPEIPKPKELPKPKPKPAKKEALPEKPAELREEIKEVVAPESGLRMAEMTDAEAGTYEKGKGSGTENAEPAEVPKIDTKKIVSEFNKKVNEEIAKNKVYPRFAQQHGLEGVVKISFSVDSEGVFQDIKVALSSGEAILDKAALESVEKSSGKIKKPSEIKSIKIKRTVVIRFELKNL